MIETSTFKFTLFSSSDGEGSIAPIREVGKRWFEDIITC